MATSSNVFLVFLLFIKKKGKNVLNVNSYNQTTLNIVYTMNFCFSSYTVIS